MHLSDIVTPEELVEWGRSDTISEEEAQEARKAVECFVPAAILMVGENIHLVIYMTALTAIERALQRRARMKQ